MALKLTSLTEGRCPCPSPAPCFWELAPCKPPADSIIFHHDFPIITTTLAESKILIIRLGTYWTSNGRCKQLGNDGEILSREKDERLVICQKHSLFSLRIKRCRSHIPEVYPISVEILLVFLKEIVIVTDKLRALMGKLSGRPTSPLGSRFHCSNLPLRVVTRLVNHLHLPISAPL